MAGCATHLEYIMVIVVSFIAGPVFVIDVSDLFNSQPKSGMYPMVGKPGHRQQQVSRIELPWLVKVYLCDQAASVKIVG